MAHFLNMYHSLFCICTYSSIHECRVLPNFVDKNIGSLVKFELLKNNGFFFCLSVSQMLLRTYLGQKYHCLIWNPNLIGLICFIWQFWREGIFRYPVYLELLLPSSVHLMSIFASIRHSVSVRWVIRTESATSLLQTF